MGNKDGLPHPPFNWAKAGRTALVHGSGAGVLTVLAKLAAAGLVAEPVTATIMLTMGSIYAVGTASIAVAGEYINHKFDDPSPVFDARTTILFDLVGLSFGFLLFVIPAMQLDLALHPGGPVPGYVALLAFCVSAFAVVVLRGLLVNLGIVRNADDDRSENSVTLR